MTVTHLTTALQSNASTNFVQGNATFFGTNATGTIASNAISVSVAAPITQTAFEFSNANGVTFGTNGSTVTASVQTNYQAPGAYLTTAAQVSHSHGNPTLSLAGGLSGATASNSAGFTLSLTQAAGVASPVVLSAGTVTGSFSQWTFSNSNNVSFGFGTGADASKLTASASYVNDLTSGRAGVGETVGTIAGTDLAMTVDTNGVSIGYPKWITTYANDLTSGRAGTGTTIGTTTGTDLKMTVNTDGVNISHPKWITTYAQSVQPVAVSGSNGSFNFSTLQMVTGNGATFYTDATGVRLSYTVPGATVFSNSNNVSFGLNGSTITATATFPAGGGDAIRGIAANGSTATTNTVNFVNSNNISFGWGAGGNSTNITADVGLAASNSAGSFTFKTLNFSNANNVTFGTSAGSIITASVAAPGAGGFASVVGNGANGTGTFTDKVSFAAGNNITLSTGASIISIHAPAGGAGSGVNRSFFEIMDGERLTTAGILNNATYSNRPIFVPFWIDGTGLNANTVRFLLSRTGGTSLALSLGVGFYTLANATSMNLISSTINSYSVTTSAQFSGIRIYDVTGLGQAGFSLGEGRYVMGILASCPATASMGLNIMGGDNVALAGFVNAGTNSTAATNSQSHIIPFWGVFNATSGALPSAVAASSISGGNGVNSPDVYAVIKEI